VRQAAFEPLAWFVTTGADALPGVAAVVLIGNAGPAMFARFAAERDTATDRLDDWTRAVLDPLARSLGARAVYPFDQPPLPFLTWARRGGGGHVSPLGLNIHPTFGLWHAYRAALLFADDPELPPSPASDRPCDACRDKPCLTACPVSAFSAQGYAVSDCVEHLHSRAGEACRHQGCLARHACPVGQTHAYLAQQAQFHMRAFIAAHPVLAYPDGI
jgi:epoxyqueuosine reductase QueG